MWTPSGNIQQLNSLNDELMLKRQKQRAIKEIIINIVILIGMMIAGYFYIYPQISEISWEQESLTAIIKEKETIQRDWITDIDKLSNLAQRLKKPAKEIEAFSKLIKANSWAIAPIIIKSAKEKEWAYLPWLEKQMVDAPELQKIIDAQNAIIDNIIPSIWENGLDYQKKPFAMKQLIEYVENILFARFKLYNYWSLGIPDIKFLNKTENIWYFDISFWELKWTNKSLLSFIRYIQCSGYEKNDIIPEWCPQKYNPPRNSPDMFDNILMGINNLAFTRPITNENEKNTLTISIRIYVRWISAKDLLIVKKDLQKDLQNVKEITDRERNVLLSCTTSSCKDPKKNMEHQKEYSTIMGQILILEKKVYDMILSNGNIPQQVQELGVIKKGITQIKLNIETIKRTKEELNLQK